ncbi:MAG: hypothetical protein ABGX72_06685 [Methyloprofundus sp.]|jgi:hypothetical protein
MNNEMIIAIYIKTHSKSQLVSFFLILTLGPLGLIYSAWFVALILTIISATLYFFMFQDLFIHGFYAPTMSDVWVKHAIGNVFVLVFSFLYGAVSVSNYNKKVKATADLLASK